MYIDSKEWQKELLPSGCKGEELKTASRDIGCRLFPKYKDLIIKLIDKGESEFGSGSSLGRHGFTQDEWEQYLKEKKYAPQHYLRKHAGSR